MAIDFCCLSLTLDGVLSSKWIVKISPGKYASKHVNGWKFHLQLMWLVSSVLLSLQVRLPPWSNSKMFIVD